MLKELENLRREKDQLVMTCTSQRLQIKEDIETLEHVSNQVESGVRAASDVMVNLRWILPLLPLGGAFSILGLGRKKKRANEAAEKEAAAATQSEGKDKNFVSTLGHWLWKVCKPGGYGWMVYKMIKSARKE